MAPEGSGLELVVAFILGELSLMKSELAERSILGLVWNRDLEAAISRAIMRLGKTTIRQELIIFRTIFAVMPFSVFADCLYGKRRRFPT